MVLGPYADAIMLLDTGSLRLSKPSPWTSPSAPSERRRAGPDRGTGIGLNSWLALRVAPPCRDQVAAACRRSWTATVAVVPDLRTAGLPDARSRQPGRPDKPVIPRRARGSTGGQPKDSTCFPEFRIPCILRVVLTLASDIEVLTRFGRALADPNRARILLALSHGPAHPSDLADRLEIPRTRLSNHLACLRDCGLIVAVPEGRRTRYELADPRLAHALEDLRATVLAIESDRTCPEAGDGGCC